MLIDRSEPQEGATGIQCVGCGCDDGLCGCDKETSQNLVIFEIVRLDYDKDDWCTEFHLLTVTKHGDTELLLHEPELINVREVETIASSIGKIYGIAVGPDLNEIRQVLGANLERIKDVPLNCEANLPPNRAQYLRATLQVKDHVTLRIYGRVEKGLRHLVERFIAELREFETAGGAVNARGTQHSKF